MSLLNDSARERFIDRDPDAASFRQFLETNACALMLVHGPTGVGKTWLLDRFMMEARRCSWRPAALIWRRTRHDSFLSLLKAYHEDLGPERMPELSRALQAQQAYAERGSAAGSIEIAQGADLRDAQIGRIVGHEQNFVVHGDLHLGSQTNVELHRDRLLLLTHAFCGDLVTLSRQERLLLILDGHDEMPPTTIEWLWEECIRLLDDEGVWPRLKFVLCGETQAKLGGGIRAVNARVHEVVPLTRDSENIAQYLRAHLRARGFDEAHIHVMAQVAFSFGSNLNTSDFCDKIDFILQNVMASRPAIHG
jgi:hypothetical protein